MFTFRSVSLFYLQEVLRIIRFIKIKDIDYQVGSLNVQAQGIQVGNNKYQKIEIKTVLGKDKGGDFENLNIILANKNEKENMHNFLSGIEENIYGESTNVSIGNKDFRDFIKYIQGMLLIIERLRGILMLLLKIIHLKQV